MLRHHRSIALALLFAVSGCNCDPVLATARALTITSVGEGAVQVAPTAYKDAGNGRLLYARGSAVTLTATPVPGSFFEGWEGGCQGTDPTCTLTLDTDAQVLARFGVTVDLTVEGTGRVVSSPSGLACTQSCKQAFTYDALVTLTATAYAGFRFDGWSGDCTGAGDCVLTTDQPHAVTARFVGAPPPCNWVKRFGGNGRENAGAVRRDSLTGRIAVAGSTQGNIDFGGGAYPQLLSGAAFVAVLEADGAYGSAFLKGRSGAVTLGDGLAWLPNGDLALAGCWSGMLDFGDGVTRDDGALVPGLFRGFLGVFSPSGTARALRPLGETTSNLNGFSGVSADPVTGVTTVAGVFVGTETFGGAASLNAQDYDAFALQQELDGGFRWVQGFGGTSYDHAFAVHASGSGGAVVAGTVSGALGLGGASLDAGDSNGAFAVTLQADGGFGAQEFLEPLPADGGSGSEARAVSTFLNGDVLLGGSYSGQVLASGTPSPLANGNPGYDGFVARLGLEPWFVRLGGALYDEVAAVAVDRTTEDVWVLGNFRGTVTFQTNPVTSAGNGDIFLARFSKTGTLLSLRTFGGPGEDFARGLEVDPFGRVLVAGEFENTVSFGGVGSLTSAGMSDAFVGCFEP